jgi:hypothetical protein
MRSPGWRWRFPIAWPPGKRQVSSQTVSRPYFGPGKTPHRTPRRSVSTHFKVCTLEREVPCRLNTRASPAFRSVFENRFRPRICEAAPALNPSGFRAKDGVLRSQAERAKEDSYCQRIQRLRMAPSCETGAGGRPFSRKGVECFILTSSKDQRSKQSQLIPRRTRSVPGAGRMGGMKSMHRCFPHHLHTAPLPNPCIVRNQSQPMC